MNTYDRNPDKVEFIHFDNKRDCKLFIEFLEGIFMDKKVVENSCCSGLGVGVKLEAEAAQEYKNNFMNGAMYSNQNVEECKICFEERPLINNCNVCNHPFCRDCLRSYNKDKCPNCRNTVSKL